MRVVNYSYMFVSNAMNATCNFANWIGSRVSNYSTSDEGVISKFKRLTSACRMFRMCSLSRPNNESEGNQMNQEMVIKKLGLNPLPDEGGYYLETYRSQSKVNVRLHSDAINVDRDVSTAIYYLITSTNFSALHRIKQDELFHFYMGDPVEILTISDEGDHKVDILGNDIMNNHKPQITIPAGMWQGAKLKLGSTNWALMGTTVAPGFEFADFELADRNRLIESYPKLRELILAYTRS